MGRILARGCRAIMAGGTRSGGTGVVKMHIGPARSDMTVFASAGGLDMGGVFARCRGAVVAGGALGRSGIVIKANTGPV